MERICFQVEEAQWFYEDFIRPLDPALPSLSLKAFSLRIFQHCPLMSQWSRYHHMTAFSEFLAYKTRVPVRGAILLNQEMDEVVLVKGWKKGANWSFPRGKINKGEADLDCAIREVYEETGFDVREAGLIKNDDEVKHIQITMREQHMRLYIFSGVPRDTHFEPRTRKEISKIEWYKLSELPTLKKNKQHDEGLAVASANKFYMVAPFLHPLKKWIAQQKKIASKTQAGVKLTGGYNSVEENGHQVDGTPVLRPATELAIPSDLPEVTAAQDASSHLKQLLNIGGSVPTPVATQTPMPSSVDQSKSSALLDLLRKGSHEGPQAQSRTLPLPDAPHAGAPPAHLAPNFFPGFPQQQQQEHMAPSTFMQQTSTHLPQGPQQLNVQPLMNPVQSLPNHGPLDVRQHELSGSSAIHQFPQMPAPIHHNGLLQSPPSTNMEPSRQVAPFQKTGDPQFSQSIKPSQVPGAAVPPASKLPPPKLTSHSLKLLDVFKGDTTKISHNSLTAAPAAPEEGLPQTRKTSQHQDSLLGLFKGPRTATFPQPVELGGDPIPPASASDRHTPQRPSQQLDPGLHRGNVSNAQTEPFAGSATMPQDEARPKPTPKKAANVSIRRNNSVRQEQAQPQQLSSPITILPRPQSAKRDVSTSSPKLQASQAPPQYQIHQPAAPEPMKPFQPQILRRSEKAENEKVSMATPKMGTADRKPNLPGLQSNEPESELASQNNFNRRPSQTAAQKEALLSLFGKAPVSPSSTSAAQFDSRAANQQPSTVSGLVSPLSSLHFPNSGDSISRHGTPSESETTSNRIASPGNKEFLLGYLQGVAKGNK